ncbi:MAG: cyclic nucleotide-binding domain-containing protein [Acidobacteriota bacterium]
MIIYLANIAYALTLCAFIMRDMLRLRSLLVCAQAIIVVYAWNAGINLTAFWNSVFVCINAVMVIQILRERRSVVLPQDLRELHARHFAALSPPEFLRWWRQGRRETLENQSLTTTGQRPEWLYFVLDGIVRVQQGTDWTVELPAGYFVAEMSLLTGDPANADVTAVGTVNVIRWSTLELRALQHRNAVLWAKIQSVIGHDLVEKIRRQRHVVTVAS